MALPQDAADHLLLGESCRGSRGRMRFARVIKRKELSLCSFVQGNPIAFAVLEAGDESVLADAGSLAQRLPARCRDRLECWIAGVYPEVNH
jgi:hypothetical protein